MARAIKTGIIVSIVLLVITSAIALGAPNVESSFSTPDTPQAVAVDSTRGLIYTGGDDNTLYAVNASDMSTVEWTKSFSNSIVRADYNAERDTIYVGDNSGNLYAIDAGTQNQNWNIQPLASGPETQAVEAPANHSYIYFGQQTGGMAKIEPDGSVVWTQSVGNSGVSDLEYSNQLDILFTGSYFDADTTDLQAWNPENSGPTLIWDRYDASGNIYLTTIGNRVYIGDGGNDNLRAYDQSGSLVETGSSGDSANDQPESLTSYQANDGKHIIVGEGSGDSQLGVRSFDTTLSQEWSIPEVETAGTWGNIRHMGLNSVIYLFAASGNSATHKIDTEDIPQEYEVTGNVTDKNTGNNIQGVTVKALEGTTVIDSDLTNANGFYSLNVTEGTYDFEYSKTGYEQKTKNNININSDTTIDTELKFEGPDKIKIIVNPVFDPGQTKDYKVRIIKDGKVLFVEDKATVYSENASRFTVDNTNNQITAVNTNKNFSAYVNTTYNGTKTRKKLMVGELTVENLPDCPPDYYFLCFISIDGDIAFGLGSEMQIIIGIIIIASGLGGATENGYVGLGMLTVLAILFFAAGMLSLGITISTFLVCVAVAFGALNAERNRLKGP